MINTNDDHVKAWKLHRLVVPLGRTIGDNNCSYDAFDVCALELHTASGHVGWGFGELAHGGVFRKPVSWKGREPMPSQRLLAEAFDRVWPLIEDHGVESLLASVPVPWKPWQLIGPLHAALRMALWDLRGKVANKSLYRILGKDSPTDPLFAYISPCAYPQTTEWVVDFFRRKTREGFRALKVKVGNPDVDADMDRLRRVREAVGDQVEIAVDANTAWSADEALRWIGRVDRTGVNLSYCEDPLAPDDLEGYRLLAAETALPIVGHDYLPDPERLRPLLDTGVLRAIRMRDGIDHGRAAASLAEEYNLALIQCNTFGEHGIHFALTHPRVERIEFADLGWNGLFQEPVNVVEGRLAPPSGAGLGLVPRSDRLEEWKVED